MTGSAEVIAIGDELTSGQRVDTNSAWISEQLGQIGIKVVYHTTVSDDMEAMTGAFRLALERVDTIVCTGGLGPTADDLTRQALAAVLSVDLVQDDGALGQIRSLFKQRGYAMPERNKVQAMFPRGSRVIPNPHGSAPGIEIEWPRDNRVASYLFALPGVPAEMKEMWKKSVEPRLREMGAGKQVIRHKRIKCFGAGESALEEMLPDLIRRGRQPSVGITVHKATITLRVTARGSSPAACQASMQPTIDAIRNSLGNLVFGEDDDELEHVVSKMLRHRRQTLSTIEWATRGMLASWLQSVVDNQNVYHGGYSIPLVSAANRLLAVDCDSLIATKQGRRELTELMAIRARDDLETDYAVAVGPDPNSGMFGESARQTHLYLALAGPNSLRVVRRQFTGHPDILIDRAAKQALDLLRLSLLNDNT